jgi:stress-induced-phosphoprotein 1
MSKAAAQVKKNEGNNFFKAKNYREAIAKYTEAIALDGTDVTFFSNRSACYAALEDWENAAEDGRQCIMVDNKFVKGYFRYALGLQNMNNFDGALDAVKRGLGIDSTNADLKKMSREIDEAIRMKKVESAISCAEGQLKSDDVAGAYKTIDNALRLDPQNDTLNSMMNRVRPLYERAEKKRVSTLDPSEKIKEEGDNKFKAADFEGAIKTYTKCLDMIRDKTSELALKCYGNRAACYKQLSNFDGTIADCTSVLEQKPDDVKSLIRRAQAFEACERYKSALQDVRAVLAFGVDNCGKQTYDLANGMQHRLNRVINQLKQG